MVKDDKYYARKAVSYAKTTGKLIKQPCEICGEIKVDAHHYLGYKKENWLKVKWVCRQHHAEMHNAMRMTPEQMRFRLKVELNMY